MKFIIGVLVVTLTFSVGFSQPAQAQYIPAGLIGWAIGGWRGAGAAVAGVAITRATYRNRQQPVVSNYYTVRGPENAASTIDYQLLAKETADEIERREQAKALAKLKAENNDKFQGLMSKLIDQRDDLVDGLGSGENICYALCGSFGADGVLRAKSVISKSYDKEEGFDNLLNQCGDKSIVFWDLREATDRGGTSYQHLMLGNPEAVCRTKASGRASGEQPKSSRTNT